MQPLILPDLLGIKSLNYFGCGLLQERELPWAGCDRDAEQGPAQTPGSS